MFFLLYPSESVTRICGDRSERSDLAIGEWGEAKLSLLLLFDPACWCCCCMPIMNMWAWWGGGDLWCMSMGNLSPAALCSRRDARAATAAAAICCWWPRAWGITWLVHSTSLRSSSMSRFSLARRFWNHVITCNQMKNFNFFVYMDLMVSFLYSTFSKLGLYYDYY